MQGIQCDSSSRNLEILLKAINVCAMDNTTRTGKYRASQRKVNIAMLSVRR